MVGWGAYHWNHTYLCWEHSGWSLWNFRVWGLPLVFSLASALSVCVCVCDWFPLFTRPTTTIHSFGSFWGVREGPVSGTEKSSAGTLESKERGESQRANCRIPTTSALLQLGALYILWGLRLLIHSVLRCFTYTRRGWEGGRKGVFFKPSLSLYVPMSARLLSRRNVETFRQQAFRLILPLLYLHFRNRFVKNPSTFDPRAHLFDLCQQLLRSAKLFMETSFSGTTCS